MWQKKFEQHRSEGFTVVGLALDSEGIAPAKRYYEKFGVSFPALVDPDYATKFEAVPKTFFVDEHGVIMDAKKKGGWEAQLAKLPAVGAVTDEVRSQWSDASERLNESSMQKLTDKNNADPVDLETAAELGSRYIALEQYEKAEAVLARAAGKFDAQTVARTDENISQRLSRVYFQWSRAAVNDRKQQVERATTSFYLDPTIGYGKQIARIISPEKFDGRPKGDFDNKFREGTLRRLKAERKKWLLQSQAKNSKSSAEPEPK